MVPTRGAFPPSNNRTCSGVLPAQGRLSGYPVWLTAHAAPSCGSITGNCARHPGDLGGRVVVFGCALKVQADGGQPVS